MRTWIIIALSWIFLAPAAAAENLPVTAFAQIPTITSMQVSPDGRSIAYFQRIDGEYHLKIVEMDGDDIKPILSLPPGKSTFRWVQWVNDDRVIISYAQVARLRGYNYRFPITQILAMDKDGENYVQLIRMEKRITRRFRTRNDDVLNMLPDDPKNILIGHTRKGDVANSVYKLNVYTAEMELVFEPDKKHDIDDWYSDLDGNVRYGYGRDKKGRRVMLVRQRDATEWKSLHKNELFEDGRFRPLGFSFDDRYIYVSSSHIHGRDAIFKFDLETGEIAEKIFEHDTFDVTDIIVSTARRKVVAVQYTADMPKLHFLDEEYARFRAAIDAALPDRSNYIRSTTRDENFAIVFSTSDRDPGSYYLYNNEEKRLVYLVSLNALLEPEKLAPMKRVTYAARDSLDIPAYLTLPVNYEGGVIPTIILPHGGPWARDYQNYDYWSQFLANRGYAVLQPNYRGSSGYGDRYEALGYGGWGRVMQDDVTDGAKWLIREGIADPDNICIVGGSYGGYAALMGVIRNPEIFKCAAAFAPVTDVVRMLKEDGDYSTNDFNYRRVAGNLTKKELARISPIKHVKEITAPILLVHGDNDYIVPVKHSRRLAKALTKAGKHYEYIEQKDGTHTLDTEEQRIEWLRALEKFLAENLTVKNPESAALE